MMFILGSVAGIAIMALFGFYIFWSILTMFWNKL